MSEFQIGLSEVLEKIRRSGTNPFNLTYRKEGGLFGKKENVCNRVAVFPAEEKAKRDLSSISHETQQAGKLHLMDEFGQKFDLHICLLVSFNGKTIDHTR
ncbi:hypothetical protein [Runella zeae]|uniref:hypothetical protein n=1 Tax=Runella zeae TaxID=94255 RepID=UPI0023524BCF|nr:hypothetical protein [Runella zeae]